eukprot:CAMPEP_0183734922 /NCGR_PEP_ID=MMETSP0737-20130205/45169_1 /TAXON_ID=385413 /ORGANISM="Thalassiosira miniscula, Strain CCMP1093" /LENGTH=393 /DNA_ID=CAMNT_0025968541 /DNA_START=145 /DNA_END=1326 /DNA_ORIENTATION=+
MIAPSLLLLLLLISADALTITTFNILAPVHRSMNDLNHRESEREDWWRPRAEKVADYISRKFSSSDVILLQEWWFDERFNTVFDSVMGDSFERVAERRPLGDGAMRDDGMCCLVRKGGALELVRSEKVLTGPQRIAQIVQCRERCSDGEGRNVFIANSHLSFPGDQDPVINNQRQAKEAGIILDALSKASAEWEDDTLSSLPNGNERLEVVCGDFNSNSCGLAASLVESPPHNFVNCASADALSCLTNIGGRVNLGVTHQNHLGERVSVDHIFLRLAKRKEIEQRSHDIDRLAQASSSSSSKRSQPVKNERSAALALGFLDAKGTRILNVRRGNIHLEGSTVLSDHRPVTAKIAWPRCATIKPKKEVLTSSIYVNVTRPLDPLEPAWGIVDDI